MKLTKKSETSSKITFTYDKPPGAVEGYLYYAGGVRVSRTMNPNDLEVTFGTVPSGEYRVEAVGYSEIARAEWPETTTPPPVGAPQNLKAGDPSDTSVPLTWDPVTGATSYKVATVPPGAVAQYTTSTGPSKTVTGLLPSTTYEFDVQAIAAAGESAWHGRISAKTDPGSVIPPPPTGLHFAMGGSGDETKSASVAQSVGAKLARSYDKSPGTAASSVQSSCQTFQSLGVRPYILCNWQTNDDIEALTPGLIPAWASAVGPGGTWYSAHPEWAGLAVTHIEMGNEWFYNYRGGINQTKCGKYARAFRDTVVATRATNRDVKFLFMTDIDNQGTSAYNNMVDWFYAAVPDIHNYIDGYTFHVYGPPNGSNVFPKMTDVINRMQSHGAPNTIPIWVTEDGISSDNGRTLSNNYGWPVNMTYAQAGVGLRDKFTALRTHAVIGPRLQVWTNYQAHDQQAPGASSDREAYFGLVQQNGTTAKGDMTQSARDHARQYP